MGWVCPQDRAALERVDDGWSCPGCGKRYPVIDGISIFADRDRADDLHHALVDELWQSFQQRPVDLAAAEFCKARGCSRTRFATNWKSFFSPRPGGTTLEIGAGIGDDSLDLAASSGAIIVLVPSLTHARIVKRNLDENSTTNCDVGVITDLSRLPLRDASIDAAAMEDVVAGFEIGSRNFGAVASELGRVIAPEGTVFFGLANGLHQLPGMKLLRGAILSKMPAMPLNRLIKRAGSRVRLGPGRTRKSMTEAGFRSFSTYAPLPDADDAQIVLPVDDARAVRYFLNNLIRKNSGLVRLAIRLANVLVSLGLFRYCVPYYYLIFRNESRHSD